jgi:hypothetical protein
MSSRQLEEMQELRRDKVIAETIGTTIDELREHEWDIDENVMSDGTVAGYILTFVEGTDAEFLKQVGAYPEGWRPLSINAFDETNCDDPDYSDT